MPSDESLLQTAEDSKTAGNAAFANGDFHGAISSYSQGLVACDRMMAPPPIKASLLSNRAMCYLKLQNFQKCVEDCDTALEETRNSLQPQLRCKLLFRRAKANATNKPQEAAKDLLNVLTIEPHNVEAQALLNVLRASHKSSTPVSKLVQAIRDDESVEFSLKSLLNLLDQDVSNVSRELGRLNAYLLLFKLVGNGTHPRLALQVLRTACGHPESLRTYLIPYQQAVLDSMQCTDDADCLVSCLAILVRMILHADRDDPQQDIEGTTKLNYDIVFAALQRAIRVNDTVVLRAVLDVLSTFTAGLDRDSAIRAALHADNTNDSDLAVPKTQYEIRAFTPQQLAAHKKRELDQRTRDLAWAFERSILFCSRGVLCDFLDVACQLDDPVVRRECTVAIGRLITNIGEEDKIKDVFAKYLQSSASDEPKIVQDTTNKEEESGIMLKRKRAMIACAILISKKEMAGWALGTGWAEVDTELPDLIDADIISMGLAAEVLSVAATIESARGMVSSVVNGGLMEKLLMCDDRDVRSGAASAVAKLGLSEKSSQDEGEAMGLLHAACELLEDRGDGAMPEQAPPKKEMNVFRSSATSSVDRAVEMITYLIPSTTVKEELAAGFSPRLDGPQSSLDLLVKTADTPSAGESLTGYGLATIFQNMAATNETIRKEGFEGREVTMEQYDEMQRMGKTEEEKELMNKEKDTDTTALCHDRIRKMASANVPRALVALCTGASEHTLEQIIMAMCRMAEEQSVRGVMIQQGVLSSCIKIEKNEGPTETDGMKKVIRLSRHCIAKMLITTNPSLLTSAQRLGSVRPLIRLVRDIKSSDLMKFEALLAVTNIGSTGEDAMNRIVAEKGIPSFHFAMFSDHEMVRRGATEAMCNLVPHKDMMDHLAQEEHLKLWLAFADDFEENYECARAAAGCLAMATQDETIAQSLIKLEKFKHHMTSILESGRLEIMHRAFVIVLNLVLHGGKTRDKAIEDGLVAFSRAYIELQQHSKNDLEFALEERQLLPVTVDIAKEIVKAADQ